MKNLLLGFSQLMKNMKTIKLIIRFILCGVLTLNFINAKAQWQMGAAREMDMLPQ